MPETDTTPIADTGVQILVCSFYQIFISFVPSRLLRRVFPPVVTGTCLVLLGSALIGAGFQNWGGGAYCASQVTISFCATVLKFLETGVMQGSFFWLQNTEGEPVVGVFANLWLEVGCKYTNHRFSRRILQPEKRTLES
jgi:xanthine/uracil permease